MDNREFFNSLAYKWDEICDHDDKKIREILELSNVKKDSKILDIGTGTGILISYLLEKLPSKLVGVDISENMIEVARKKYKDEDVKFIVSDIMNFNEDKYDYIFIYSAYPHFKDKEKLFEHLSELLNENGKVIIAHSQSRDEINHVHSKSDIVKEDILLSVEDNSKIINKYLKIEKTIDNSEMYYIEAIKNMVI
ncbi:class I SAM-dependent methyltransferase [Clostridium sp. 1001271B_151109_B4]|uniref:class I SAM-dependent methyltransferase n=1 Tax=Clostridium sp. 1001271B_151109_B4 TaxID=2787148 RepID=UPI0018AB871F|nr:class I SAM-dependent methyltransferase [Clostridium sp. 1001271B_151109_B4]